MTLPEALAVYRDAVTAHVATAYDLADIERSFGGAVIHAVEHPTDAAAWAAVSFAIVRHADAADKEESARERREHAYVRLMLVFSDSHLR